MTDIEKIRGIVADMEPDACAARDYIAVAARCLVGDSSLSAEEAGALYRVVTDGLDAAERVVEAWTKLHEQIANGDKDDKEAAAR